MTISGKRPNLQEFINGSQDSITPTTSNRDPKLVTQNISKTEEDLFSKVKKVKKESKGFRLPDELVTRLKNAAFNLSNKYGGKVTETLIIEQALDAFLTQLENDNNNN